MHAILLYPLLIILTIILLSQLLILAAHIGKVNVLSFYGRSLVSFLALFLCAFYGTLASALLNLAGYGGLGQYTAGRAFKWCMWVFTRVWFDIQDENDWLGKTRPAVFVGNHQTELDVLVLGHVFPKYCSVTSKRSLKFVPVLGWFMTLSKTVFIERSSRTQAFAAFDAAAAQMHAIRQSVYIFPEGTRSYYDHADLLPFKKGAFHLAIQAQVPIVPIVVANYSNILDFKKKKFTSGRIPLKVLKPVETKGRGSEREDVQALLDEVRSRMLEALKELTEQAREEGVAVKKEESRGVDVNGAGKSSGVNVN